MKYLILFFLSFNLMASWKDASNYVDSNVSYSKKSECEKHFTECIEIPFLFDMVLSDYDKADELIDGQPQYSVKTNIVACGTVEDDPLTEEINEKYQDCLSKFESMTCDDPEAQKYVNQEMTEAYCSKFLGFEQVPSGRKILVLNQAKKDARLAEKAAKEAEKAAKKAKKDAAKGKIDKLDCNTQAKMDKDLCEFIQGM